MTISSAITKPGKYLIIDDHPVIAAALAATLGAEHCYLLALSLEEGLGHVRKHLDIDLIIYDLNLPDSCGMEGLQRLRLAARSVPVLVYSALTNKKEIQQAFKLGVLGFVPKTTATDKIQLAVQVVLKGDRYVPEEIIGRKHKPLPDQPPDPWTVETFLQQLTDSEKRILPSLVDGQSNKELARLLERSEHTVRVHVQHIFRKAGVKNRTQLAAKWFRWLGLQ